MVNHSYGRLFWDIYKLRDSTIKWTFPSYSAPVSSCIVLSTSTPMIYKYLCVLYCTSIAQYEYAQKLRANLKKKKKKSLTQLDFPTWQVQWEQNLFSMSSLLVLSVCIVFQTKCNFRVVESEHDEWWRKWNPCPSSTYIYNIYFPTT